MIKVIIITSSKKVGYNSKGLSLFRIVFILLFAGLFSFNSEASIKIGISSTPSNLNPFFSTDANSQNINRLLHTSLIDFDMTMNPVCRLCESFKEINKKGKQTIRFKLRKDITFWDGSLVRSKDVKRSWELYTEENSIKSIFRFAFGRIKNVRIINELEFELEYNEFKLDNLSNLVLFKILKLKNNEMPLNGTLENIVGAGRYLLKTNEELSVVLASLDKIRPNLEFKVVKDETTLALKLLNNELDMSVTDMSARKFNWLKKNAKQLTFLSIPSSNVIYMNINHEREFFKDVKIRKAISHLIPREEIKKYKFKDNVTLSNSLFSKSFKKIHPDFDIDNYDPELASKLFIESGYEKKEGKWYKGEKLVTIDWKSANTKSTVEMAQTIIQSLERFGLSVQLTVQEWGTFMKGVKKSQFDLMIGQWVGFTGAEMLNFVFSSESIPPKGGNRGLYKNPKMDALLNKAQAETDELIRNFYYREALKVANEDYSYINLWHPNNLWIHKNCLQEVNVFPNGSFLGLEKVESHCGN